MTENGRKRAALDFGDIGIAPPAIPPVDSRAIKAASHAAGFRETPEAPAPEKPKRRGRKRTGRTQQFATRLRPETLDAMHAYADRFGISLAETIERAMRALSSRKM